MGNNNTDNYSFSPGQSVTEHDDTLTLTNQHVTNNDEELSISENTISSDKQLPLNNIRNNNNTKKKVSQNNHSNMKLNLKFI